MQPHPDRNGPTMSALGYDPVPGDVDAVRRVATMLGAVADQADTITTRLRGIDDGTGPQVWRGPAADAFHRLLDDIGPDVIRLASAHREAEDALRSYAGDLDGAQFMGRRAESDAGLAISDRERAEADRARAAEEAAAYQRQVGECRLRLAQAGAARLTALTDPVYQAELTRYEGQVRGMQQQAESRAAEARGRENAARSVGSAAEARVQAARLLAEQAKQVRDDSARRVVDRLDAAGRLGTSRKLVFARLGQVVDDLARVVVRSPAFSVWLDVISITGSVLTIIGIGVAVLFLPAAAVGGAIALVGTGFGVVSFLGTALAVRYGTRTRTDLAIEAAGLVPGIGSVGKLGRVITRSLPWAPNAVNGAAKKVVDLTRRPAIRGVITWTGDRAQQLRPLRHFAPGSKPYKLILAGHDVLTSGPRLIKSLVTPPPPNLVEVLPAGPPAPSCSPASTNRPEEVRL